MGERELLFIELVDKLLAVSSDDGNGRHGNLRDKGTRDECFYIILKRQTHQRWATELKHTLPHDDLAARYCKILRVRLWPQKTSS